MHKELTEHENFCMQNNHLPTPSLVEARDNSSHVWGILEIIRPNPSVSISNRLHVGSFGYLLLGHALRHALRQGLCIHLVLQDLKARSGDDLEFEK